MKDNMNFYTAYHFLENHKLFNDAFAYSLYPIVVKVNPDTYAVEDDDTKNTKVRIWLECGGPDDEYGGFVHDIDLDCGGDTFEEAIIELAKLVKKHYTDDGKKIYM